MRAEDRRDERCDEGRDPLWPPLPPLGERRPAADEGDDDGTAAEDEADAGEERYTGAGAGVGGR